MRNGWHGGVGRAPRCRVWEGIGGAAEAHRGEGAMMARAREGPWAHGGDPAGGRMGRSSAVAVRIRRCPGPARESAGRPKHLDRGEAALAADLAALDVDAGEAEQEGGDGLRRRGRRRQGLAEEVPAARQLGLPGAVGEDAEVPNADKVLGDDVEQEAADELLGRQRHDVHAVTVAVVFPAKAHDTGLEIGEAVVGEGDAVGVAPEVLEHLLGTGEGGLGVDHPVLLAEGSEPRGEGARGGEHVGESERPRSRGTIEGLEVLGAEDHGERPNGEEEPGLGRNPPGAVGRQGAPGDDAVQMDVLGEGLAPRVEDRGHPQVPAEMAGIVGEGAEGGRGREKEERVEQPGVAIEQDVERMGQRQDDVEVLDGEQLGAPGVEPARRRQALALGPAPVATGNGELSIPCLMGSGSLWGVTPWTCECYADVPQLALPIKIRP